jgi:D-tyrosyl-tRNA(Tyr) deacylase
MPERIGPGLVILLGVGRQDGRADVDGLADKALHLRIFEDEQGRMNRSLIDTGGEALVVSQFTLYGDTRRGRRPGFSDAAPPEVAAPLYEAFIGRLREQGVRVTTGRFGARMVVEIHNDGPVTLMLESP